MHKSFLNKFPVFLLLCIGFYSYGQGGISPSIRGLRFEKSLISLGKGDIENTATFTHSVYDSTCVLWLAFNNQVSIYDGNNILNLNIKVDGNINYLSTSHDWVWYATDSFLILGFHNGLRDRFHIPKITSLDKIVDITIHHDKKVYITTYKGHIYLYDITKDKLTALDFPNENNLNIYDAHPIYSEKQQGLHFLWATDYGVYKASLDTGIEIQRLALDLKDILVTDLLIRDSVLYIGTQSGIVQALSLSTFNSLWATKVGRFSTITELHLLNDLLYVGMTSHKITTLASANGEIMNSGLEDERFLDFDFYENSHTALITEEGYLQSFIPGIEVLTLPTSVIQSIAYINAHNLLIGTQEGAYHITYNYDTVTHLEKFHKGNIISIHRDNRGNIWLGTFGKGLFKYYSDLNLEKHISTETGLPNNSILSIDSDSDYLWVGTLGGVARISMDKNVVKNISLKIGAQYIYHIEKSGNRLYFSTDGFNMGYIDFTSVKYPRTTYFGSKNTVYTFDIYDSTSVIYPLLNQGIFIHERGSRQMLFPDSVINPAEIGSILYQDSLLIIVSQSGIILNNLSTGKLIFLEHTGNCNLANHIINASSRYKNGLRFIAIGNCILRLDIEKLKHINDAEVSPLFLKVNGVLHSIHKSHKFKYWQNSFTFAYVSHSSSVNNSLRYEFKIEGIHKNWEPTSDHILTFSKIPPGNYTFNIRTITEKGIQSPSLWQFKLTVEKQWWLRWWFILLILFLTIALVYYLADRRQKTRMRYIKLNQDKVQAQLEALQAQVNPHFLFNSFNTLLSLIETRPDKAVRFTEDLSDFYRKLLNVEPNDTIPFRKELNLSRQYLSLMRVRYPDGIEYDENVKDEKFQLIPFTVQLLIENALKHNVISEKNILKIRIYDDKENLYIQNSINRKSSQNKGKRFGLKSLNERYKHKTGREIHISQVSNLFTVTIPKITDDESSNY